QKGCGAEEESETPHLVPNEEKHEKGTELQLANQKSCDEGEFDLFSEHATSGNNLLAKALGLTRNKRSVELLSSTEVPPKAVAD
ncbi:hypothetical protein PENTCL1PPCAC_30620, partial [Pristionchus entomophagus]